MPTIPSGSAAAGAIRTTCPRPRKGDRSTRPSIVLQSRGQHSIVISDQPGAAGGITLKSAGGVSLLINDNGIFMKTDNGTVNITGTVNVNNGALTVSK